MHSAVITLPRSNMERTEAFSMGRANEGQLGRATNSEDDAMSPLAIPEGNIPMAS